MEGKAKEIDKLNKELFKKNEKLRSLSLNHRLNQNERDVTKKDLEEQKKINKDRNFFSLAFSFYNKFIFC